MLCTAGALTGWKAGVNELVPPLTKLPDPLPPKEVTGPEPRLLAIGAVWLPPPIPPVSGGGVKLLCPHEFVPAAARAALLMLIEKLAL